MLEQEIITLKTSLQEKSSLLEQNQVSIEDLKTKIKKFDYQAKDEEVIILERELNMMRSEKTRVAEAIQKSKIMIENSRKEIITSENAISGAKSEKDQISGLINKQKEEAKKLEQLKSSYKE